MTYLTTKRESTKFDFQGTEYIGATQPKALMKQGRESSSVDLIDRASMEIRVTSLERTLVDCFDRLDLVGGIEEVWRSLESVTYLKLKPLLEYVELLENAVTAAKVGFFVDMSQERLHLSEHDIDTLRDRRPKTPTYTGKDASRSFASSRGVPRIRCRSTGRGRPCLFCAAHLQHVDVILTGELTALLSIRYLRHAVGKRVPECFDTEVRLHGVGQSPAEHKTALPIDDRY